MKAMTARFNQTNILLAAILIIQVIVAVVIFFPSASAAEPTGEPLLSDFDAASVSSIIVKGANDETVSLAKNEAGEWVLPDNGDFPVQSTQVDTLLSGIAGLQANRLIAQNDSSHARLKVADNDYEREIELQYAGSDTDRLYMGTSGGGNATHMRVNDDSEVYLTSGLATWEVATRIASWIDTLYFSAPREQIARITIENANGTFNLVKSGEEWTLTELDEGESFNSDKLNSLLGQISNLRMTEPISKEAEDRFGMDAPSATITVVVSPPPEETTEATSESTPEAEETLDLSLLAVPQPNIAVPTSNDTTYTIIIGAELEEGGNYVVKSSASDYYVQVSNSIAQSFANLTHADLVIAPEAQPTATPGN